MANSAAALVAQIVSVICGLVLPRLILESFGSEINGLTQSIKQFLGVISFLDLGVGQVMRSALYRPLAKKDDKQLSCVMCSGRKFYKRLACILMGYVLVLMVVYPMLAEVGFGWLYVATLILAMAISSFAQYYFGIANEQLRHWYSCSGRLVYGYTFVGIITLTERCSMRLIRSHKKRTAWHSIFRRLCWMEQIQLC